MRQKIGRAIVILALALLFFAYSNFLPTSLSNDLIADYVKNHFIREVIFGVVLAALAIRLSLRCADKTGVARPRRAWVHCCPALLDRLSPRMVYRRFSGDMGWGY